MLVNEMAMKQCFGEREAEKSEEASLHRSEKREAKRALFSCEAQFNT